VYDLDPQYKTEDGAALRIWRDAVQNNYQTEQQGRPIFDEAIYVEVITPGSQSSIPVFEVKRIYHESAGIDPTTSEQYKQYKKFVDAFESDESAGGAMTGTPLKEWPELSRSMIAALRAQQIYTVEALAGLPDTALPLVGPDGRTWRSKAQAYLDFAANAGTATAKAAENERLKEDLAAANGTIASLAARLDALEANKGSLSAIDLSPAPEAPEAVVAVAEPAPAAGDGLVLAGSTKSTPAKAAKAATGAII